MQVGGAAAALALLVGLLLSVNRLWNSTGRLGEPPSSRRPSQPSEQPSEPSPKPAKPSRRREPSAQALDVPPARPPKLARIVNQTIDEGTMLQFKVRCDDLGTAAGRFVSDWQRVRLRRDDPSFQRRVHLDARQGSSAGRVSGHGAGSGGRPENLGDQTTFSRRRAEGRQAAGYLSHRAAPCCRRPQDSVHVGATNPDGSLDEVAFSLPEAPRGYPSIRPRAWSRASRTKRNLQGSIR